MAELFTCDSCDIPYVIKKLHIEATDKVTTIDTETVAKAYADVMVNVNTNIITKVNTLAPKILQNMR
jgi:hypothetical protein